MSRLDDIKKLITNHQRRLQKLKELQALQGLSIESPRILIEIEDIETTIAELQEELAELKRNEELSTQAQLTVDNEISSQQKTTESQSVTPAKILSAPSPEPEPLPTKLPQTPSPQPIQPEPLPKKSAGYLRDPIWQMIGVVIAVITLAWAVYTFYAPRTILVTPVPTLLTSTGITQTVDTPTSVPTPIDTSTIILTSTPNPPTQTPAPPNPTLTKEPETVTPSSPSAPSAPSAPPNLIGCEAQIVPSGGTKIIPLDAAYASASKTPWTLERGTMVIIVQISANTSWYQVRDMNGRVLGWVPDKDVKLSPQCHQ